MYGDFTLALIKQVFTVQPAAAVHAILYTLPADIAAISDGYLDHSSIIVCPPARRCKHNPVGIRFLCPDGTGCQRNDDAQEYQQPKWSGITHPQCQRDLPPLRQPSRSRAMGALPGSGCFS